MAEHFFRYVVPIDDQPHVVELQPARAADLKPLAVAAHDRFVEFWAAHCDDSAPIAFTFQVVGTGHSLPPGAQWCGTAPRTQHGLVWHLVRLPDQHDQQHGQAEAAGAPEESSR